ncbi:Zn-ribbon domain-containing OB-fold protein [Mycolicibacterium sp. XJ1819]
MEHQAETVVVGSRCQACGREQAFQWPRCAACGGPTATARFGPEGVVWSSTVVRIPVAGYAPPYCLAYVDLDEGPRVLAHVTPTGGDASSDIDRVAAGTRVRLVQTPSGNPTVEVMS